MSSTETDMATHRIEPSKATLYATMYTMLAITSIVFFGRMGIRFRKRVTTTAADILLAVAYVCFLAHLVNYILATPPLYRQDLAVKGIIPMYPEFARDNALARKYIFANVPLFWATLWAVKLAFLSLYRQITAGIRLYAILWWIVLATVIATFIVALFFHFFSCTGFRFFAVDGCISHADLKKSQRVVYFSFAADVFTDILILLLPLNVLRKLQRPMEEKIGLIVLFLVGIFCPLSAVLRITKLSSSPDFSFVIGWLALWGAVETCVVIVCGCVPGIYVAVKDVVRTRTANSTAKKTAGSRDWYAGRSKYGPGSKYGTGSKGYTDVEVAQERVLVGSKGQGYEMKSWNTSHAQKRNESTENTSWYEHDSHQNLSGRPVSRQASDERSLVKHKHDLELGKAF